MLIDLYSLGLPHGALPTLSRNLWWGPGDAEAALAAAGENSAGKKGLQAVLEGLGQMWGEEQYTEELSLDAFIGKLK